MRIVALMIGILIFGGFFFSILVYPIWLLVHCAIAENRSTKSKVIWIVLMLLAWPLTGLIYGLFGSKRRLFQWISGIIITIAILALIGIFTFMGRLSSISRQEITRTVAKIDQMDTSGLSVSELKELKLSMLVLGDEMKMTFSRTAMEKLSKDISLMQLFYIYAKDDKISSYEYGDWVEKFKSRDMIDRKALERYIAGLTAK
ncbi:MAG: hypothetical protein FJZ10_05795 [Candidatus Omnitrophica bacterium]|nr:hypothetical protein [Candidatus Omnitrophota bacterium]